MNIFKIIIIVLFFLNVIVFCAVPYNNMLEEKAEERSELYIEKEYIYNKYKPIEDTLKEISSRTYTEDYRCIQFSEDAVKMLGEDDIKATMISGYNEWGESHRWIAIEFEPIYGTIVKSNEYNTQLLIKNK